MRCLRIMSKLRHEALASTNSLKPQQEETIADGNLNFASRLLYTYLILIYINMNHAVQYLL